MGTSKAPSTPLVLTAFGPAAIAMMSPMAAMTDPKTIRCTGDFGGGDWNGLTGSTGHTLLDRRQDHLVQVSAENGYPDRSPNAAQRLEA